MQTRRVQPPAALILLAFAVLTLYSFLRGQRNEPEWAGLVYYVIDYSDGLIRRALIGQLFMLFYTRADSAAVWAMALVVHRAVAVLMMGLILIWLWTVFWRRHAFTPLQLGLIYLIYVASQFLPTLAATNTYVDGYVFLLIAAAFALAAHERHGLATLIGLVAPLIHEMAVILWGSLILMVIWRHGWRGLARPAVAAMGLAPFLTQGFLMAWENPAAVHSQLARAPLSPVIREAMGRQQLGHRLLNEIGIMAGLFAAHPARVLISVVIFTIPALLMVAAAGVSLDRRGRLLLAASSLLPLGILLVGYDLTRFVVITQFSAMISILFMATGADRHSGRPATELAPWQVGALAVSIALMLPLPLVYGYFDQTHVVANEVLDSIPWLGGHLGTLYEAVNRWIA
jgi:hypothetical protein